MALENTEDNSTAETTSMAITEDNRYGKYFVYIFSAFFGISSLIGLYSVLVQLPLLVISAPEKWRLPSYILLIMAGANIFPWTYTAYQNYAKRKINDAYVIIAVQVLATTVLTFAIFFVNETVTIGNSDYSVPVYIIALLLAVKAATSTIVCIPYMGRFTEKYMVAFFVGEGFSSLIPGSIALAQGVGETECILTNSTEGEQIWEEYVPPPRFSSNYFFGCIFAVMLISTICFILLDKLSISRREYDQVRITLGNDYEYAEKDKDGKQNVQISIRMYRFLMILLTSIAFMATGVLPSIQTYSTLPYSNQAYHLASILGLCAGSLISFAAFYLPRHSIKIIVAVTFCFAFSSIYLCITALMSPNPPFVGTTFGEISIIIAWIIEPMATQYAKISIFSIMRSQGGKSLVWAGSLRQFGIAVGTVFIFSLLNFTDIFKSAERCEQVLRM